MTSVIDDYGLPGPVQMMDSKNFVIGILSTTATILLVGIVLLYARPNEVQAGGMTTSGGRYIVTVGSITQIDEELVYILDTSIDRMVVYRFDGIRRQIEVLQGIDLAELHRSSPPRNPQPAAQPNPRTRQP